MIKATKIKRNSEEFYATKPLKSVKFMRRFLPWQLYKFIVINFKVMIIVAYGHS